MKSTPWLLLIAGLVLAAAVIIMTVGHAQVANVSRTDIGILGANISTPTAAISNTYFDNDANVLVLVRNNTSTPVTATVISQQTQVSVPGVGTVPLANAAVSIPSSSLIAIGPFPTGRFNTVNGTVAVSFTSVTGISLTIVRETY